MRVEELRMLTKSLRPLPDKWHGMADVDSVIASAMSISSSTSRAATCSITRNRILRYLRDFLESMDFLEVETPMLQSIPGGAAARPFRTHHNALDMDMYLRIAPELFLKRLTVGGFERVYEINRNFRNEGVSTRHNPEFTMLELYVAYADYKDLIVMVERAMQGIADVVFGKRQFDYQGRTYDLDKPFTRITVSTPWPRTRRASTVPRARRRLSTRVVREERHQVQAERRRGQAADRAVREVRRSTPSWTRRSSYAYPTEVSPLSRANDAGSVPDRSLRVFRCRP